MNIFDKYNVQTNHSKPISQADKLRLPKEKDTLPSRLFLSTIYLPSTLTLSPDATISSLSIEQHSTELHSLPRCLGACLLGLRTQLRHLLLAVRVLVTGDLNDGRCAV